METVYSPRSTQCLKPYDNRTKPFPLKLNSKTLMICQKIRALSQHPCSSLWYIHASFQSWTESKSRHPKRQREALRPYNQSFPLHSPTSKTGKYLRELSEIHVSNVLALFLTAGRPDHLLPESEPLGILPFPSWRGRPNLSSKEPSSGQTRRCCCYSGLELLGCLSVHERGRQSEEEGSRSLSSLPHVRSCGLPHYRHLNV